MQRWLALVMMAGAAWGQGDVDARVARLVAYAERYRATLPSLVCEEQIVSEEVKDGKVKKEVDIEGTFRVTRTGPPESPFAETHVYRTVNGQPATKHFGIPYLLTGAFANGIGFNPETLSCYANAEEPGAVAGQVVVVSTRRANASDAACERTAPGTVRRTVVDEATGHVLHVEVRTPAEMARKMKRPFFAEIDYGPVVLGEEAVWLPLRVATQDEKDERRFVVRYSDFHRYGGAITILPGMEKVPEP